MPRKGLVFRRTQATDPVYASDIVEKFICSMMWEGKKSTAQRVFYGAMDQVAKKTNDDALENFQESHREREAVAGSEDAGAWAARTTRFRVK